MIDRGDDLMLVLLTLPEELLRSSIKSKVKWAAVLDDGVKAGRVAELALIMILSAA
jgi:hypothetical protein